jgi:hypothetical protein
MESMVILPIDCLGVIVDKMIDEICTIYWTYDLLQDVEILSKVHNCYPELVEQTIEKIKDLKPSYKDNGKYIQDDTIYLKYMMSIENVPKSYIKVVGKRKNRNMIIHEKDIRQYARKQFPSKQEWFIYLITKQLNISEKTTPLIYSIMKHMLTVLTENDIYQVEKYSDKFYHLKTVLPNASPQYAQWIYENFVKSTDKTIEDVELDIAETDDEKHQVIERLSKLSLPKFEFYHYDMLPRAKSVCNLCVKSEELAWEYISTGLNKEFLLDNEMKEYKADMIKIGIEDEDIDYALEECCDKYAIEVIHLFARYNARISYNVEDENDGSKLIVFDDCEINGINLRDIPDDWTDNVFLNSWGEPMILLFGNMEYETALGICETLTRYKQLQDALSLRLLQVREYSILCKNYVISGEGDTDHIVSVMEEMSFFYKHTKYPTYIHSLNFIGNSKKIQNSEKAKLAALVSYDGNTDIVPTRFNAITKEDKDRAYEEVMNVVKKVQEIQANYDYSDDTYSDYTDTDY